ncbi:tyrosine-protein phosphatase [Candidatus Poriferisocius sp.]|uniref:tyrosine-protein phosphatase n=1 Tax=Candidatus Poriferisocius sp. TaxID=3101276 RepID=UPI003B01BC16
MGIDVFEQLVPVGGTKNLRDLGGIQAAESRVVRGGVLYRSDTLHEAVGEDLARLDLACVVDFRSAAEVERRPDRLDGLDVRWVNLPIDNPRGSTELLAGRDEDLSEFRAEIIHHWLNRDFDAVLKLTNELDLDIAGDRVKRYVSFATDFASVFAEFFAEVVAASGRPLLYHCEGGTDRTGAATALLLGVLGVERKAVVEDYLATNTVIAAELEELRRLAPPSLWPILGAHESQIHAFLDHIENELGGLDSYARSHLNLTDKAIDLLRSTYLTAA